MESEIQKLSDAELLRILNPALAVAVGDYGVPELLNVAEQEVLAIKGIGDARVKMLMALKEIVNRIIHRRKDSIKAIHSPADAIEYFQYLAGNPTEEVWVMLLDNKHHVIGSKMVTRGTISASAVGMREIYSMAIKRMAAAIVVAHNHPSGIATPSQEDIRFTKELIESSKILGIQLVDHIIIAKEGSLSLREDRSELFNYNRDIF